MQISPVLAGDGAPFPFSDIRAGGKFGLESRGLPGYPMEEDARYQARERQRRETLAANCGGRSPGACRAAWACLANPSRLDLRDPWPDDPGARIPVGQTNLAVAEKPPATKTSAGLNPAGLIPY